jgi:hypothetical protein
MNDEQKPEAQADPKTQAPKDWSPDYFPTSARKIFMGWGLMLAGIVVLCTIVYLSSSHPQADTSSQDAKRIHAKQILSGIEDTIDDEE